MCRASGALEGLADGGGSAAKVNGGRDVLPANVKPTHYNLTLEPNLETFEFRGEVVIEYVDARFPCAFLYFLLRVFVLNHL